MLGSCSACGNHEWDKEVSGCGLDRLPNTYGKRFFSEVNVLALTADPEVLKKRMTEGRFPSCIYYLCRFIITNKRALWFSNKIKGVWMLNSNKQIILFTGIVA